MTRTIEVIAVGLALLIAALAAHAWLEARDDQRRLQSTLAAQKQLIDAADARETSRVATLQQTLAQIEALKRAAQTPAEILRDLPNYISLPAPIAFEADRATPLVPPKGVKAQPPTPGQQGTASHFEFAPQASVPSPPATSSDHSPDASSSSLPSSPVAAPAPTPAEIPAADLKPLYDYVQDCRACQARLAAATQDLSDDNSKIAALTRERDAAVTASRGGTFWTRFRRNALWLAIGAGLGYAAHR